MLMIIVQCLSVFIIFITKSTGLEHCMKINTLYSIKHGLKIDFDWLLEDARRLDFQTFKETEFLVNVLREYDYKKENYNFEQFYSESFRGFIFPPYSLLPGKYTVELTYNSEQKVTFPANFKTVSCFWVMKPIAPIALISGGITRIVSSNNSLLIKGDESVDDRVSIEKSKRKMLFSWFCTTKNLNTFCKKNSIAKSRYLVIPAKNVLPGEVFNIQLQVQSSFGFVSVYNQTIIVGENNVPELYIKCELNCPPQSDYTSIYHETFLTVTCKNCFDIKLKNISFLWTIYNRFGEEIQFDFYTNTHFGQFDRRLAIKKHSFKPGKYLISVMLKENLMGRAEIFLDFDQPPLIDSCIITPNKGIELVSGFFLKCFPSKKEERKFYFELILNKFEDKTLLAGTFETISNYSFRLPILKDDMFVKVCAPSGVYLNVPLQAPLIEKAPIGFVQPRIVFNKFASIRDNKNKFYQQLKEYLHYSFINHEIDNEDLNFFINDIIDVIKEMNLTKNDLKPLYKYLPNLKMYYCNFLTGTFFEKFQKQKFPRNMVKVKEKLQKLFGECTSKTSLVSIHLLDDPDAVNDSLTFLHNTTMVKAKSISRTMADGTSQETKIDGINCLIIKDIPENLANKDVTINDIQVHLPKYLRKESHNLDVLIAAYPLNTVLQHGCKANKDCNYPTTPAVDIQIWHSNGLEEIKTVLSPVRMKFKSKVSSKIISAKFACPENYDGLSSEDLNSYIQVFKFPWKPKEVLLIEFHNLSDSFFFYSKVVSQKYPTADDFGENDIVSLKAPKQFIQNKQDKEVLGYLGIMAAKGQGYDDMVLEYSISITGIQCYTWNIEEDNWLSNECNAIDEHNDKEITCYCIKTAVVAGYIAPIDAKYEDVQSDFLILKLQSNNTIFCVSAVLLLIYCVMLVFTAMRMPKDLYYLCDNVRSHRYCYLVIVKTSNARNAGTTSNVMIKIHGKKTQSQAHVLNYPDPQLRLLQRDNEDMFVITTRQHLGKIKKIDLWFNCTGPSPAWTCKNVIIFDLQTRKDWTFDINQKFTVVTDGVTEKSFEPKDEKLQKQSLCERIKIFNEFHTWHFTNKDQENFSNMKRLTIILSNVMSIQALDMIIHGLPAIRLRDSIDYYGSFMIDYFTFYSGVFSALLSFLIHISIAWTFRFSRIRFARYRQDSIPLSYNVTKCCWILLTLIILSSTTMLITFGFWVPYYSSLVWLASSTFAVANDVLLYENIFILVRTKVSKIKLTDDIQQHFSQILTAIENQRALLHQKLGTNILRNYCEHFYRKMDTYEIREKRVLVQQRRTIVSELEDMAMFGVYILILFICIFTNRAPHAVIVKSSLEDIMNGQATQTNPFKEIKNIPDFHNYLDSTLLQVIHPTEWYTDYPLDDLASMMVDGNTKFLGVARIRQHRMKKDNCQVYDQMKFLNLSCTGEYSRSREENRDFFDGWKNPIADRLFSKAESIWDFLSAGVTGTEQDIGEIRVYPGSGYVANLGRSINISKANIKELRTMHWIDDLTRCVIVEFLTYNANYNVFSAVKLILELSATGYVGKRIEIQSERMMYRGNPFLELSGITYSVYVFWVGVVFIKQGIVLIKNFKSCYKNIWFLMDLSLNTVSILAISLYFIRIHLIGMYIDDLEKFENKEYINYATLFYIENIRTVMQAFLVTVGTIRLWRYLRFGIIFRIMERTLGLAADGLLGATLGFGLVLISFGISGILIFGNDFYEFSSMLDITRTLITMCLKPDQFQITDFIENDLAYLYFTLYLLLMQINMVTYVVVIVIAYSKAQLEFSDVKDNYNIKHYMQDQLSLLPVLLKYKFLRLRGGQNVTGRQWVYPKADEFLYADSVSTEVVTMNAMFAIAKSCLRNLNKREKILKETDFLNMLAISRCVIDTSHSDEVTLFFKGRIEGQPLRLVDERKIELVARIAQSLLAQVNDTKTIEEQMYITPTSEHQNQCSTVIKKNRKILKHTSIRLLVMHNFLTKANLDFTI